MRHRPPCKTDGIECPRRYIGCRADCEAYHDWLAKHEAEKKRERKNREYEMEVDGFLILQGKRTTLRNQALREKEKRMSK